MRSPAAMLGRAILFIGLPLGALSLSLLFDPEPITIQSQESKTATLSPVFNRINWRAGASQDIWIMQQSHSGRHTPHEKWDRIAMVIEKGAPRTATFYQLSPGHLSFDDLGPKIDYRAACLMCHPNGPRAIRPDTHGELSLSMWNRMRLFAWNIRIKSYGRVQPQSIPSRTPFRYSSPAANAPLLVAACVRCHRDGGLLARGTLRRQNFLSIGFMIDNHIMPPFGLSLSEKERREIELFIGRS
ncbi:MAG: cytochrome c [Deltaproteobacteria bacterium]|nr:cytochrome c [Deltaproteobacteria bacterium]MBI3295291.1 cytochrome c [Deltaproteobacteria bacterium]